MKWIAVLFVILLVFSVLAILQVLPEPIQEPVNDLAGRLFPQKKALEQKQDIYKSLADDSGNP